MHTTQPHHHGARRQPRAWLALAGILATAFLLLAGPSGPSGAETTTTTEGATTTESTTTTEATTTTEDIEATTTTTDGSTSTTEDVSPTTAEVEDSTTTTDDGAVSGSGASNDPGSDAQSDVLARTGLDLTGLTVFGIALIAAGALAVWSRRRTLQA